MSRTAASVIALMLGLPVLIFVAAGVAAGINPSIYTSAIGFLVAVCFVGAAVLEILRLARLRSEDLVHGWMPKLASAPTNLVSAEVERTQVEVLRVPKVDGSDAPGSRRAA